MNYFIEKPHESLIQVQQHSFAHSAFQDSREINTEKTVVRSIYIFYI